MRARALKPLTLDTYSQNKDTGKMKSSIKNKTQPKKHNFFTRKGINIVIKTNKIRSAVKTAKSKQNRTIHGGLKTRKVHICPKDCGYQTTRKRDLVDHVSFSHSENKKLYHTLCCGNKYHRWTSAKRHVLLHFKNDKNKKVDLAKHISKKRVTVAVWKEGLGDLKSDFARYTVQKIHEVRKNGNSREFLTEWLFWKKRSDFTWEPEKKIKQIARLKLRNWKENQKVVTLHDVTL